jgi:type I restriction enzyme M protein
MTVPARARRTVAPTRAARPKPGGIAALNSAIWSVCDVLRRSKCAGAMQYVPELTWILFLRVLDDKEQSNEEEAEAVGAAFAPSLKPPYRWRDWAAPSENNWRPALSARSSVSSTAS